MARTRSSRWRPALVALSTAPSSESREAWPIEIAAALLLGLASFLAVVGPAPLDPRNIAWLAHSDAATNYLGWAYFRSSPWMWPPAANPDYGLDIAGSVMMADANPSLALPFKLLSPWLPTPFQYFGWWLLGCFLLQALFARAIAARLSDHAEQRLAIALLFLFAPCFLIRIATPAIFHMTLAGQWQILAALWLYMSSDPPRRALAWSGLLSLAVLTHPYLLMMVLAIWLADLLRPLVRAQSLAAIVGGAALAVLLLTVAAKLSPLLWLLIGAAIWLADRMRPLLTPHRPPRAPVEHAPRAGLPSLGLIVGGAGLAIVSMAVAAKLSGVYWLKQVPGGAAMNSYGGWGFGLFKANSLSPIDSEGWSWLLPDLPSNRGEIEGFAFLGLGVLLLGLAAILLARRAWPSRRIGREHVPLLAILIGFALFAISHNVAIGHQLFHLAWPQPLIGIGNMFRSSGRFLWPLVYCAMIAICWIVLRGARRQHASPLLIAAALIQVADTSAGWRAFATTFAERGPVWPTGLRSPFWAKAAQRYRAVRTIVPRNQSPLFRDLGYWAFVHGMPTDLVNLARVDMGAIDALTKRRAAELRDGRLDRDSLWITDGVPADALARMPRRAGDFVGTIDGIPVYAPDLGR